LKAAHIERKRPKSPRNYTAGNGFERFCVSGANRQFGSEKEVNFDAKKETQSICQ